MKESFPYSGRANAPADLEPEIIQPEAGYVLCLVVRVADFEIVNLYANSAIINRWGIRLQQPFRRLSKSNMRHEFAEYFPKDLYIFCPARLQIIPMEGWMLRSK